MDTIDQYLGIPDVAYRDARMLRDPAQYEEIGGHANMEMALEGFRIVPFPCIGTLQELPVSGAYTGYHPVQLISYDADGEAHYMFWRADYAAIDFDVPHLWGNRIAGVRAFTVLS